MATDPVRRIRHTTSETAIELNLRDVLEDLAAFPASLDAPYLTVSLDWSPDGSAPGRIPSGDHRQSQRRADMGPETTSHRPSRTVLVSELERIITAAEPRSDALANLEADRDRILHWLDTEIDPSVSGVYIVANSALDIFETIPLGLSVETRVAIGPTPNLSILARVIDDHPTFAVLVADQENAVLTLFSQNSGSEHLSVEASGNSRPHTRSALDESRIRNRANERMSAFAKVVAGEMQTLTEAHNIDRIVLAGDSEATIAIKAELHQTLAERVLDTVRLKVDASEAEILAVAEPLVTEAERAEEQAAVDQLASRIGADDRAVAGIDGVLRAFQQGSVRTLIIADDLTGTGWGDFEMNIFGSGPVPAEHPAGGNLESLVALDLDEELIRLSVTTGAEIQFVHTARKDAPAAGEQNRSDAGIKLDEFSGVGALLRFDA